MRKTLLAIAAFATATTAFAAEYTIDNLEELREFMEAVHVEDFAGSLSLSGGAMVRECFSAGVTALSQAASRKAASWPGYDFAGTWSILEDSTTPYFAWSLADAQERVPPMGGSPSSATAGFRLFAVQEPGATITIGEGGALGDRARTAGW